jgi:hypothetical protein
VTCRYDGNLAALARHLDQQDADTCSHCGDTGGAVDCCDARYAEWEQWRLEWEADCDRRHEREFGGGR